MNTPPSLHNFRRCRGFTIVELAAVLAIASILLCGAIPSFTAMFASARTTAATNAFVAGLQLTRSEAIKRSTRAVMCKSSDGQTCAIAGEWDQGWIVFQDANDDANRSPSETLIWREPATSASLKVAGNASVANYISFAPMGGTQLASGAFQAGTVTVCTRGAIGGSGRQIVLNAAGRPRVQKTAVAVC
jgi:type IV fimbrial biogenesis protein FimT